MGGVFIDVLEPFMAMWLISILLLLGVALLITELVLLPGISIAGVGAIVSLGGAVFWGYTNYGFMGGTITLTSAVLLSIVAVVISLRSKTWQRLSLNATVKGVSTPTPSNITIGQQGITLTRLAPMGKVILDGATVEAKSIDVYIDPRQAIEVIGFENTVVIVAPIQLIDN